MCLFIDKEAASTRYTKIYTFLFILIVIHIIFIALIFNAVINHGHGCTGPWFIFVKESVCRYDTKYLAYIHESRGVEALLLAGVLDNGEDGGQDW